MSSRRCSNVCSVLGKGGKEQQEDASTEVGTLMAPPLQTLAAGEAFSYDEIRRCSSPCQGTMQCFPWSTRCCQRTLSSTELQAKGARSCSGTRSCSEGMKATFNVLSTPTAPLHDSVPLCRPHASQCKSTHAVAYLELPTQASSGRERDPARWC